MPLQFPPGEFKAFLYDCDGTVADSMPAHFRAWNASLGKWGCSLTLDEFYAWAGTPTAKIIEKLNALRGLSMPIDEVMRLKERKYLELLDEVGPVDEVVEHVRAHKGRVPIAVVSGGLRNVVVRTLQALGLEKCFDAIVTAEDYSRGKPEPDAFLLAARKLGVSPEDCLVFEDAELGLEAARRAGMAWVKVEPESHRR